MIKNKKYTKEEFESIYFNNTLEEGSYILGISIPTYRKIAARFGLKKGSGRISEIENIVDFK
jgi:hypothetical protein